MTAAAVGTVSVQPVMSRNSAIAAVPARNFLTKKTPVDATRAHIAIKKQEMLTVTCPHLLLFIR